MKHIVVTTMRKTSIGMFSPRVVYTVDDASAKAKAAIKALVDGKDASGRKTRAPAVGRIVSAEEAAKLRKQWAQEQVVEYGGSDRVERAAGEGAINTISLADLTERAERAEADKAALTARAEAAEAELRALQAAQEGAATSKAASSKSKAAESK